MNGPWQYKPGYRCPKTGQYFEEAILEADNTVLFGWTDRCDDFSWADRPVLEAIARLPELVNVCESMLRHMRHHRDVDAADVKTVLEATNLLAEIKEGLR